MCETDKHAKVYYRIVENHGHYKIQKFEKCGFFKTNFKKLSHEWVDVKWLGEFDLIYDNLEDAKKSIEDLRAEDIRKSSTWKVVDEDQVFGL